ncbi:MAG: TonB-dependent receptor, partial [Sphingobacteriaceae bacterium]
MPITKLRNLLLGILAVTSFSFFTLTHDEDDLVNKIATQLDKWLTDYPQEKVHLHLDKPYYAIGEDIWFKAYVTIGEEHRLSALSGILNVELINDNDSVAKSIRIPLISGLGWGDFRLSDSLTEGNYRIRAYTNYMRNAGDDYFFDKTITIANSLSNKVFTRTTYGYSQQNGKQSVNAAVAYANLDSVLFANKPVTYQVISATKIIKKGKGVTDVNGNINISFINDVPATFKSGSIITVIEVQDKEKITKVIPVKAMSDKVDMQFFPESGNLVNGISSKVAFKAVDGEGLGKDINGVIKDEQGAEVATFKSSHLGMGVFNLMPQQGKTYTAHINFADGSASTIALPKAQVTGYVLSIDASNPAVIGIKVLGYNAQTGQGLTLIAQAGGKLLYAGKSKVGAESFSAFVPVSRFPSGIVQFTLFSAAGQPINERLVFVLKNDLLKLDITSAKKKYAPREKVKLDLTAKNGRDSLVEGSFSLAVIDETKVKPDEDSENSILSDILLTSDIKGYVEKPNYYFINPDIKKRADLDVLMLTQGYRRFEWKNLLADNFLPMVYQPERSIDISGTVTYKGKPLPGVSINMVNTAGQLFAADTTTDAQGKFRFRNLLFTDSAKLVFQATNKDGKRNGVNIVLDNIAPQLIAKNKNTGDIKVNIDAGMRFYLQNMRNLVNEDARFGIGNHTIQLKEVVVKEKVQPAKNSSNLNGPGNADQVLEGKDLNFGCSSLDMCLQSRLFGVVFMSGVPYSTRNLASRTPMQVIVDGVFVETSYLQGMSIAEVESVEVLRTPAKSAIYGSMGYGGVLIITTKHGTSGGPTYNTMSPGMYSYTPKGYYLARQFYSP